MVVYGSDLPAISLTPNAERKLRFIWRHIWKSKCKDAKLVARMLGTPSNVFCCSVAESYWPFTLITSTDHRKYKDWKRCVRYRITLLQWYSKASTKNWRSSFPDPWGITGLLKCDFLIRALIVFLVSPGLSLKGDEDGCGCVVKSVLKGGAVGLDGRIGVGDHIVTVNDESMIGLSSHKARYRNKSLIRLCTQNVDFGFFVSRHVIH